MDFLSKLFDSQEFMPHGYCFLWFPDILYLHVIADVSIAIAYFAIPIILGIILLRRRKTLPFRWVFLLFAMFIFLCGTTHLLGIVTLWYPIYYFEGVLKVITAAVSLATAFMMFPLIPRLLELLAHLPEEKTRDR